MASGTKVRKGIHSRAELERGLHASLGEVRDWIAAQPVERFARGPEDRWTLGQHLDHLVRSVQPINSGLLAPKFVLGLIFGTSNRPSLAYAELAAKYEGVLDDGGKASGRFVPPNVHVGQRGALLAQHRKETERLISRVARFSEEDLDRYVAPHPLLGKLTLRELLFFTMHHHDHHLHTLRKDYAI